MASAAAETSSTEGTWFIESQRGWSPWTTGEKAFAGDGPFRYTYGKTEFEAQFQSETEGIQINQSTGKVRRLQRMQDGQMRSLEGESQNMPQDAAKLQKPAQIASGAKAPATKPESLPTCYFLAATASSAQAYEGEFEWVIELEKGWSVWMPGNRPFEGCTDQPLRYKMGRYDFEVNFESDTHGSQTNLSTGKVRRVQRKHKADPMPSWEGTGTRRRCKSGAAELPAAPAISAASTAQAWRAERRIVGGYPGGAVDAGQLKVQQPFPLRRPGSGYKESSEAEPIRPQVSQSAHQASSARTGSVKTSATVPHYMRGLKSKSQP